MPVDEVGAQAADLAGDLDVVEAVEELLEHHVDLHAGEVGAEAEVRAAAAERDVLVRRARDVERERVVELLLVAVRRDVPEDDLVAVLDLLTAELVVDASRCGGSASPGSPSAASPRRRAGMRLGVGAQPLELLGVLEQRDEPVRDQVARGLVAGDREQQEEEVDLEPGELLTVDLGLVLSTQMRSSFGFGALLLGELAPRRRRAPSTRCCVTPR